MAVFLCQVAVAQLPRLWRSTHRQKLPQQQHMVSCSKSDGDSRLRDLFGVDTVLYQEAVAPRPWLGVFQSTSALRLAMAAVKRKIHFFKIVNTSPNAEFVIADAVDERRHKQFTRPATAIESAYLADDDGEPCMGLWVHRAYANCIRLAIGTVRSDALPSVDDHGNVTSLDIADKSLLELTHCVFFPTGIVGVEFNFYGPRATRLPEYFAAKCPSHASFKLQAIANQDASQMLSRLREIQLVSMRVFPGKIPEEMLDEGGLFGFLGSLKSWAGADNFEIVMRPRLHSQDPLGISAMEIVKGIVGWPNMHDAVDQLKVEGKTRTSNKRESFDLLSDKFVVQEEVMKARENSRSVDSTDMFAAIHRAYNNIEGELLTAARVEL